jgi:hypothetical protein
MTDHNTLTDYNIKDFGKLSRHILNNQKVGSYQYFLEEEEKEGFESIVSCHDRICIECENDHSFRDAITFIDMLPELFPHVFKKSISRSQEFVNWVD